MLFLFIYVLGQQPGAQSNILLFHKGTAVTDASWLHGLKIIARSKTCPSLQSIATPRSAIQDTMHYAPPRCPVSKASRPGCRNRSTKAVNAVSGSSVQAACSRAEPQLWLDWAQQSPAVGWDRCRQFRPDARAGKGRRFVTGTVVVGWFEETHSGSGLSAMLIFHWFVLRHPRKSWVTYY